jgi:hypothetical protein
VSSRSSALAKRGPLPPHICNRAANRSRLIVALVSQELRTRPDEDHWLFRVFGRQSAPVSKRRASRRRQWCLEGDLLAMARTPCKPFVGGSETESTMATAAKRKTYARGEVEESVWQALDRRNATLKINEGAVSKIWTLYRRPFARRRSCSTAPVPTSSAVCERLFD